MTDRPSQPLTRRALAAGAGALLLGPGLLMAARATGRPEDEAAWAALVGGGAVGLLRHARTSGGAGDPPGFRLEDCATQRNLTEAGREQARRLGEALRARPVRIDKVLASRWCRARETAELLGIGPVEPFTPLDNAFTHPQAGAAEKVRDLMRSWSGAGVLLLVTHGSNIIDVIGVSPAEGELVVVRPAPQAARGLAVVGRIQTPV